MTTNEQTFDFICVGSGGGGLVGALAAKAAGLSPLIIEKQQYVGGSTAMSGGVIWVPNNPLMRAEGVPDSYQEGLDYFDSVVGKPDQGSSMARRNAFLTDGPEMLSFVMGKGVKFKRCEGYSDYYDNRKGGNARSRSIEGIPWDANQLGSWHYKINPGMGRAIGLAVMTNEVRHLPAFLRSPKSFRTATQVLFRTYISRLRGKDLLTNGMSFVGQMTKILVDEGIPIWLNTPVEELIVEGGQVVGVRVLRDGVPVIVRGNKGVLLSAGGFERNPEMRLKYTEQTRPNDARWTRANLGNTGEVLEQAIALGAKIDYMDEAVWNPVPRDEIAVSTLSTARQYPGTMYVNKRGERFTNESNSYVELGNNMYGNDAVPAWLIFDDGYRRRYPQIAGFRGLRSIPKALPGRMPKEWTANGWVHKAETIEGLAKLIDLDPQTLAATVSRFNEYARQGQDPDFHRGESQYNKVLGDPGFKPNQALGALDKGPFYATEIFPGDVGTAGGVVCDEFARVLDQSDTPIPGLYATGNMTATVTGRFYMGAGSSIANTTTFGYIAARHAAGVK